MIHVVITLKKKHQRTSLWLAVHINRSCGYISTFSTHNNNNIVQHSWRICSSKYMFNTTGKENQKKDDKLLREHRCITKWEDKSESSPRTPELKASLNPTEPDLLLTHLKFMYSLPVNHPAGFISVSQKFPYILSPMLNISGDGQEGRTTYLDRHNEAVFWTIWIILSVQMSGANDNDDYQFLQGLPVSLYYRRNIN